MSTKPTESNELIKPKDNGITEQKFKKSKKDPLMCFFTEEKQEKRTSTAHPYEEYEDFNRNPPIPVYNFIIDNVTLEIIEDQTGKP